MAKQHQARGEDSSALRMYQLAAPHFPHNEKLAGFCVNALLQSSNLSCELLVVREMGSCQLVHPQG
jgi:hypothetical protein